MSHLPLVIGLIPITPTYPPTHPTIHLPTHLPIYLPTYLPTLFLTDDLCIFLDADYYDCIIKQACRARPSLASLTFGPRGVAARLQGPYSRTSYDITWASDCLRWRF